MSEIVVIFFILTLFLLAIPTVYSLHFFFLERQGSTKKIYLKYIFLFLIFYILFYILYFTIIYSSDFFIFISNKYNIYNNILINILIFIFWFSLIVSYIFLMKKYFSFNDINLFFILKIILTSIIIANIIESDYFGKIDPYAFIIYLVLFVALCWILFFINLFVQKNNSRKRKKQSDANHSERDGKEEEK